MSSGIMQRTNIPDSGISDSVSPSQAVNLVWLAPFLLALAWFWANISAVKWLLSSFVEIPALYKIAIGFLIVALVVRSLSSGDRPLAKPASTGGSSTKRSALSPNIVLRRNPLLLMLGAGVLSIGTRCIIDIPQLTVLLFILGTYGLCGLFAEPNFWQKNLPIAGLLACILPFSNQFNSGLGLPARVMTAHVVEQLLSILHVGAISSYDILILENGIAQVDVPCSGIKTLLVGTLFLLMATWLESRKLSFQWLAVCAANLLMLLSANALRVVVLVLVAQAWQQPTYAEMLHVPLGIVGLVCACFVSWLMLQQVPKFQANQESDFNSQQHSEILKNQPLAKPGLIVAVAVLAVIAQLYHVESDKLAIAPLQLPTQILSEAIPLNASEEKFFGNYPDTQTEKKRFVSGNLNGSMLTVASTSWQTYHAPELCFVASGIPVNRIEKKQLTPAITARWLSLKNNQLSAAYWLQSSQQTTDNFLSRIGSDITHRNQTWVLVSILFDSSVNPDNTEVQEFTANVHNAVKQSLKGAKNESQAGI
ncbi:exosortase O [Microcoleus sp. A2-C5]|uniref:exosortase O n=2 Tax=Oscillatoriales TaxID=1150 RepID=UPI00223735D8|nr:exosortase O [Lyngbya sp. CCAP 1446/10]MCW6052796.1 exosortase O [Lyngbya sp. CCAP 1446/10]